MDEIGKQLKNARESMNISIEEVAEDLKIRPSQIENLEAGNREAFEDVFYLKYFIRDYAKYLGLNKDDMVDEFNEYLFDVTSRLSLDDIKAAKKESKRAKTVKSPYTMAKKKKSFFVPFIIYMVVVILAVAIVYFIVNLNKSDDSFDEGTVISENK